MNITTFTKNVTQLLLVFLSLIFFSSLAEAKNQVNSVRIWPSPSSTRVVLDLSEKAQYESFTLSSPERLVIDLKDTRQNLDLSRVKVKGKLVKRLRYSKPQKPNTRRIVIDLNKKLKSHVFALPPTSPYGNRLVIDLSEVDNEPTEHKTVGKSKKRDIIVAIVAGHGGEDPGSIGPSGQQEKKITLQIAKKLAALVDKKMGLSAVMVRKGDYYVGLNKRSDIARKAKADLIVSIHADAFTNPQPRGASVWMLSMKRANTEIGRWLEKTEKHSELLGGAAEVIQDTKNEKYLAKALLDMSMEHSIETSYKVGNELVKELNKVTKMHKKSPQAASFAVLKSPDIPSILVETGFISNPAEGKLLTQRSHQKKLAKAIFKAIDKHFSHNPPDDTLYATLYSSAPFEHIVSRGESLSVLAARYQTTVRKLKQVNSLHSNMLRIGQKLTIPQT